MSAYSSQVAGCSDGHPSDLRADAGSVTLYEAVIFFLALLLALKGLFFVQESQTLQTIVSCITTGLDALLALLVLKKLGQTKGVLAVGAGCVLGLICALASASMIVVKGVLLVFCARDESPRRFLRATWGAFLAILLLGILADALGFGSSEEFRRGGMAFGFEHPNQAALFATVSILMIAATEFRSFGGIRSNIPKLFLVGMLFLYVWLTGSRTALVVPFVAAFVSAFYARMRGRGKDRLWLMQILRFAAPLLFAFSIITAVILYDSEFAQFLNALTTGRIWLNWYALQNYSVTLFGQVVNLHVEGVHNTLTDSWNVTTTVDNTYIAGLLQYGVFAVLLWLAATAAATRSAWKSGNAFLLGASVALAFYGLSESQLMDPLLYFTLLSIFSAQSERAVHGTLELTSDRER